MGLSLLPDAPVVQPAGVGGVSSKVADRLVSLALRRSGALPLPCMGRGFGRDDEEAGVARALRGADENMCVCRRGL